MAQPTGLHGQDDCPLILVPLDGSREAKIALPVALQAARILRASVHVVYATTQLLAPDEILRRIGIEPSETTGLVIDQVIGPPAEAIVDLARVKPAALIVMTTRGHTAYQGRTVRPVVEAIIRSAPCPVLLVRPELAARVCAELPLKRILLPLDGAPSSARVIGPALDIAKLSQAEADILYVAGHERRPQEAGTLTGPMYIDQPQYEWPTWAAEFIDRFGTSLGSYQLPAPIHLSIRTGSAATAILQVATERHSDLIVLEWRGNLDPLHAKVVKGVLADAPCPVLLLRTA